MDPSQIDALARAISSKHGLIVPTRRSLVTGLAGGVAALAGLSLFDDADAKKKKKGKKKKGKGKGKNKGKNRPDPYNGPVFSVNGSQILDKSGNAVFIRGVNKMSVFDDDDPRGDRYFAEIKQSKSNSVRIVWAINDDNGATNINDLDAIITNCRNNGMLPMIELHDATGDLSQLPQLANYWTSNDMLRVIFKHSDYLLVNIGNEVGDDGVDAQDMINAYTPVIRQMRNAGIRTPLVIDAPDFGKNLEVLLAASSGLLGVDSNIIFSVHPYWGIADGADVQFIRSQFEQAFLRGIALILGEFSEWGAFNGDDSICEGDGRCDYATIMFEAGARGFGWYAWEWGPGNEFGGANCDRMNMTTAGTWASRRTTGWAADVFSKIAAQASPIPQ